MCNYFLFFIFIFLVTLIHIKQNMFCWEQRNQRERGMNWRRVRLVNPTTPPSTQPPCLRMVPSTTALVRRPTEKQRRRWLVVPTRSVRAPNETTSQTTTKTFNWTSTLSSWAPSSVIFLFTCSTCHETARLSTWGTSSSDIYLTLNAFGWVLWENFQRCPDGLWSLEAMIFFVFLRKNWFWYCPLSIRFVGREWNAVLASCCYLHCCLIWIVCERIQWKMWINFLFHPLW